MSQQQIPPTISKFEKSKDFDGVIEKIYSTQIKDENGGPKFIGIKGHTREQLLEIYDNMKKQHEAQLKSIMDVIDIMNASDVKEEPKVKRKK